MLPLLQLLTATPHTRKAQVAITAALTIAIALTLALLVTNVAWGASGAQAFQNGGTNVGNALMAWAKALLFSMGAIMGVGALIKRSVGEGVTILIIVLILGAFVYDQTDTENVIRNVWGALGG
jgi:hypothetical protein